MGPLLFGKITRLYLKTNVQRLNHRLTSTKFVQKLRELNKGKQMFPMDTKRGLHCHVRLCRAIRIIQNHMGSSETIWDHMGPTGTIHDHTGPYGTIWDHTGPYRTIRNHMGPYGMIQDHTGPYGTKLDHARPWVNIQDHTGPYMTI